MIMPWKSSIGLFCFERLLFFVKISKISENIRVGQRTPVLSTMEKLFLQRLPCENEVGSPIIVLDFVLKILMELIK